MMGHSGFYSRPLGLNTLSVSGIEEHMLTVHMAEIDRLFVDWLCKGITTLVHHGAPYQCIRRLHLR